MVWLERFSNKPEHAGLRDVMAEVAAHSER
jgi:hypothetical protein